MEKFGARREGRGEKKEKSLLSCSIQILIIHFRGFSSKLKD